MHSPVFQLAVAHCHLIIGGSLITYKNCESVSSSMNYWYPSTHYCYSRQPWIKPQQHCTSTARGAIGELRVVAVAFAFAVGHVNVPEMYLAQLLT